MRVGDAYAEVSRITRREARNFAWGIAVLPRPKRLAVAALYGFARRVDDIADDAGLPAEERRRGLEACRASVEALPEAWKGKMDSYLGITPPSDADGVMQDIHWSQGSIGYFPTYSLGNIISVQLFEAAQRAHPGLLDDFGRGRFASLLGWLREHVHRHGRKFLPREILQRTTGSELTVEPYLRYLQRKFGEIYGVKGAEAAAATE